MKHLPLLPVLLLCCSLPISVWSQTKDHTFTAWDENHQNEILNIRYGNGNPTVLSYNAIRNFGVAQISYQRDGGSYRLPQQAQQTNDLNVYIGGLKQVGLFSLSGHIDYQNRQEKNKRWDTTLYLTPSNPFILADSVLSNYTTETFDMQATASCILTEKWKVGADIRILLGASSDQTDPRPKVSSSVIPVTIGADYRLTSQWNIGLHAGIRLYQSNIDYTLIDAIMPYQYFLMRGMGDYHRFSTSQVTAYERNYTSQTYHADLQAIFQNPSGQIGNHLAIHFQRGNENARDGGSSYIYRGGDYQKNILTFSDKLQWRSHPSAIHTFELSADYQWGIGQWSDQKLQTDAEHGNIIYYTTLSKYKIHDDTSIRLQAFYRFDRILSEDRPDLSVSLTCGFSSDNTGHVTTQNKVRQEINRLFGLLTANKKFYLNQYSFNVILHGSFKTPMSSSFGNGNTRPQVEDISQSYTRPLYEYLAGTDWSVGTTLSAQRILTHTLSLGIYLSGDYQRYIGGHALFKEKNYTKIEAGIFLRF